MYDWDTHVPVELRRRGLPGGGRWNERDHPRDGEGKFTQRGRDIARVEKFGAKLADYHEARGRFEKNGYAGPKLEKDPGPPPISHLDDMAQFDWLEKNGDRQADVWDRNDAKIQNYHYRLENDPEFFRAESQKESDEIIANGPKPRPGRRTQAAQRRLAQGPKGYRRRRGKAVERAAGAGAVAAGALGLAYAGGNGRAAGMINRAGRRIGEIGDRPWV